MANLEIEFCGVKFPNPFTLAAAPPTDNAEMVARAFEAGWGGAVLKTTSVEHEVVELVYPMMAGIDYEEKKLAGLENIDLISERHIDQVEKDVAALKEEFPDKVVGASIMGARKEDWQELVRRLEAAGVDFIECSFSCPHGMPERGMGSTIGQDPELTERTARWVKEAATRVPIIIKLTPQIADITAAARAVKRSGADGVCAINTLKSLIGIDLDSFVPYPNVGGQSTFGGYSGPAVKPVALRCVAEIAKAVDIPIAAAGGISTWRDAAEFLLVGATNLQLCTAVMHHGYRIIEDLLDGLDVYLEEKGMNSVRELVGRSLPFLVEHSRLSRAYKVVATINRETCVKDDLCYIACRDGGHQAIELDEGRLPTVDKEKCRGCGMCAAVCPVYDCIRLEPKVGAA